MSQSAFSFHCMICFEEFHPDDRYPVVLPCGHTYVCNVCGDRLDKCMECRVPLYMTMLSAPSDANNAAPLGRPSSYRASRRPPSPPQPPVKKRLPLPKNVVLLSLIEATELATEDASSKPDSPRLSGLGSTKQGSSEAEGDESSDAGSVAAVVNADVLEEERIKLGTSMAVSVAGTYAVTALTGLQIFPTKPTSLPLTESSFRREGAQASDEDVDALVRYFHQDHKTDIDAPEDELKENRAKDQPPAQLSCGDRVQVVAIESGWAKLARGYGFVHADDNKLVKVGGSVDRACKLEAMLRFLSTQRKQLRLEQSKVDNMFIRLMNDLQISLMTDEDLTVIVADTFTAAAASDEKKNELEEEVRDKEPPREIQTSQLDDVGPIKPPKREVSGNVLGNDGQATPTVVTNAARGFACFANDVFDTISGSDETEYQQLRRQQQQTGRRLSSSPRKGKATIARDCDGSTVCITPDVSTLFPSATHPSPSAMSAGARAWRELHGRQASKGAGVDFKTGMSGHMALLSSSAHPHEYLDSGHRVTDFRKMSNHTGLTMARPFKHAVGTLYQSMYQSLYPTLNIPSLSGPSGTPEQGQPADSRSDRSGSI